MRTSRFAASLGIIAISLLGAPACTTKHVDTTQHKPAPPTGGIELRGLEGPVDVVVDDRGMPHIYGKSLHDVAMVQGYLMAKDRFPQMEIVRRNVSGRLAEFLGTLSPAALEGDVAARVIGFKRTADRIYASLEPDDPAKVAIDAFSEGVNVHLRAVRDGTEPLPAGSGVLSFLLDRPEVFTDWTPEDSIAIGRYLSHALSYSGDDEVNLTAAMSAAATAFPAGDPREGIFRDLWSFAPAQEVFTREGFPNVDVDTGTRAKAQRPGPEDTVRQARPPIAKGPLLAPPIPSAEVLTHARRFFAIMDRLRGVLGDESRGSNNWIVSGSKTASGAPLLANDPHLSLPAPPLFWYSHLNTKRAGGDLDVEGISLAGVPGVILGFNDQIAWGSTTANHDVTDVYEETITEGANGAPDTVHFNGAEVPIEIIKETIKVADGADVVIELENVPHHGVIIPNIVDGVVMPRTSSTALSVRWTGNDVSREIDAFLGLNAAKSLDEARTALDAFEVGAQSFVVASRDGDIFWSTQSRMPVRDPAAMTYDPATQTGLCPAMVLPGDGSAEWTGNLDERYIPHDLNPARGFIATANNDLVGATQDGNPFNDPHYAGWDYDIGHRVSRISERLTQITEAGGVTPEDLMSIQGDHRSPLGALLTPAFITAAERAAAERATPGTHPDLTAAVSGAAAADLDALADVAARLAAWTSFETPPGVDIGDGEPAAADVADSIATSIFNASMARVVDLAFQDEVTALGVRPDSGKIARVLQWATLDPQRLATYDAALGDTVLWDDLSTAGVTESRDDRIVRGMLGAITFLRAELGDDPDGWRWGRLHRLTMEAIVPSAFGASPANIPNATDPNFADGFPRPGDNFGVDASNFGMWRQEDFTYGSGPVQRLVVEMTADGPRAWNALPGGQAYDPESKHHADEAEHWRRNEAPPLYFTDDDVNAHVESTLAFIPEQ
jgi:penicillin amidase